MVFGEILEPTTRALLYEEDEYIQPENLSWIRKPTTLPAIDSILISESIFTNKIIDACFLTPGQIAIARSTNGCVSLYQIADAQFIIKCKLRPATSIGNIIEEIHEWLDAAKGIYALVTLPTASYQNKMLRNNADIILRRLSTNAINAKVDTKWKQLEQPNLITGLGANCLSYCVAADKNCTLFLAYLDFAPPDSDNSKPFVELLNNLGFSSTSETCKLISNLPEHNLYI